MGTVSKNRGMSCVGVRKTGTTLIRVSTVMGTLYREGKWNGGQAPFGYVLDSKNSMLVVNPEEAEIVRIIFDKFVHTDMGADAICNYLNQRGYTKKKVRGHELNYFARGLILKILDNPVYIGKIAYGKHATEKVKGTRDEYRRVKQEEFLLADGLHEAIIDEETWEAAREKRKRTGVKWVKTHSLEHEHILSGLIKCPVCGGGMSGTVQRRKNKKTGEYKDTFYYRCHHRKMVDGHLCDYKPMINQEKFNAEIEEFIRYMVSGDEFRAFIQEKLEEKVDVSALETEKKQIMGQLQQVQGSKNKLIQMLDRLDTGDKHYDRKYQDMQDRLDNLYDKVVEFEEAIKDIDARIGASYGKQITGKKLYEFLLDFDILYDKMTDLEKKEFMNTFIENIELKKEIIDGTGTNQLQRIEHIDLAFPVYYGDCKGTRIRMPEENTVETVVLLSRKDVYERIKFDVNVEDLQGRASSTATYSEIKAYILEKYGLKVSSLYIAQIKDKCGFEKRDNYNIGEGKSKELICPPEKEQAIMDAFRHFGMLRD